jgi:hypothetical protein
VAQGESPEFQPQYGKQMKERKEERKKAKTLMLIISMYVYE